MVATTSDESSVLPLWNVIPLRSLMTHFLAPSDGSKDSATCMIRSPFGSSWVSGAPMTDLPNWKLNPLVQGAGSNESVVEPCPEPYLKMPPFLGSARAAVANMVLAVAAVTPMDKA